MNRCEEVLKHSINKGLKIEKDELYHSDTYLGSEYDEGLKHWKYIKRYRSPKTGKWVYVYTTKEFHQSVTDADYSRKVDRADQRIYEQLSKEKDADPRIPNRLTRNVQYRTQAKKFKERADWNEGIVQYAVDNYDIKKMTLSKIKDKVHDAKRFINNLLHIR